MVFQSFFIFWCNIQVITHIKRPTYEKKNPETLLNRVPRDSQDLIDKVSISWNDIKGVGISFPGPVNAEEGIVITTHVLSSGWEGLRLKNFFEERLGMNGISFIQKYRRNEYAT